MSASEPLKIAITGHTSGIGKALFEGLEGSPMGFSRQNGHDINLAENRQKIIEAAKDCDVFINSAKGEGLAQTHLLMELFEVWRGLDKHIINIGSRAAVFSEHRYRPHMYSVEKQALHSAVRQLQNCDRQCQISNLALGMVDTPANEHAEEKDDMMDTDVVVRAVEQIISSPREVIYLELW